MNRWFAGFSGGLILGLILAGGLAISYVHYKTEHERYMGRIDGLGEAMEALRDEFGEVESAKAGKGLFNLKTSSACVVVVGGVKTVRVVP